MTKKELIPYIGHWVKIHLYLKDGEECVGILLELKKNTAQIYILDIKDTCSIPYNDVIAIGNHMDAKIPGIRSHKLYPIKDFPDYRLGMFGNVYSLKSERFLAPFLKSRYGDKYIALTDNVGQQHHIKISDLFKRTIYGKRSDLEEENTPRPIIYDGDR